MKGTFITFEGGEGSGKSTQARMLAGYLKHAGYDVVQTREPGGTAIGDAIRTILLNPELSEMNNVTELLLLSASRAQNVAERIKPGLERGNIVVCDRYTDSTLAYQGYGRDFDLGLLKSLNKIATGGVMPDFTILLDVPVELGLARSKALDKEEAGQGQADRFELEDIEFHRRLRKGFLKMAEKEPERFIIIPVDKDIETTHRLVAAAVEEILAKRKGK